MEVKIKILDGQMPTRGHEGDAAYDLYAPKDIIVKNGQTLRLPMGIALQMPDFLNEKMGIYAQITDRSSMAKKGIHVHGGVIDSNYRGEISVVLQNHNGDDYEIKKGDRIAQIIFVPILYPKLVISDKLDNSVRGEKSFGSTGK